MVFYRKYRPQKLSELDSEFVRNTLFSMLGSKEIPHALLFAGPKGLGKTSAARIVAKIINCERIARSSLRVEKRSTSHEPRATSQIEPCNTCAQCISITNGTNLDVLEIDAASNRGIDEIRDLREKIALAPGSAAKKIYIIDEVHMLTTEAFNALLKMLEEPPVHVMFILCTTEMYKVPATIASRCFHIAFSRANDSELFRSLKRIVRLENIVVDQEALAEIAKISDGSFRDASKLIEQVKATAGRKKITSEIVSKLTGRNKKTVDFISLIAQKNAKEALQWLNTSVDQGLNIRFWMEDLLAHLHDRLLLYYGIESRPVPDVLKQLQESEVKELIVLFTRANQELKTTVLPQLPAELAIIEYCLENSKDEK